MFSEVKAMWLLVMFDLPVKTKAQRREYTRFRNLLLANGCMQLQFSVYARFCVSRENADTYGRIIQPAVPAGGFVRVLMVTDKQFGEMVSLYGDLELEVEQEPEQLLLF